MHLKSPAKINLHLRIGRLGADKFHPLLSWMTTVGLFDTIDFRRSENKKIHLACDRADLAVDEKNLIVRAGLAISSRTSRALGANVVLQKVIPMGGGLGGGSSNAATALRGFNKLWHMNLSEAILSDLAAQLGSDVPFFLHGPSSICTGRGEHVVPIAKPAAKYAVLIFPELTMPTPAVYRRFDEMNLGFDAAIVNQPDWKTWTTRGATDLLPLLVNDLEAPAFSLRPDLGELRAKLEQTLQRIVRMSGSGSTLFTLADTKPEAEELADQARRLNQKTEFVELGV